MITAMFVITIGAFLTLSIVVMGLGIGVMVWLTCKHNDPYDTIFIKPKHHTDSSVEEQTSIEPIETVVLAATSEVPLAETETAPNQPFVPITVDDDELIAPPMAKSKLEWEDTPADDSDIISDQGQLAMLAEMAREAELRREIRMEAY